MTTESCATFTKQLIPLMKKLVPKMEPEPALLSREFGLSWDDQQDIDFKRSLRDLMFPLDMFSRKLKELHDDHLVESLMKSVNGRSDLVAYQYSKPNKNENSYRVELYYASDDGDHQYFYLGLSGSHGYRHVITDENAYDFAHQPETTLCIDMWKESIGPLNDDARKNDNTNSGTSPKDQ